MASQRCEGYGPTTMYSVIWFWLPNFPKVNWHSMWADDGQPVHVCGFQGTAIGWLERGHPYCVGVTPPHIVARLAEMLQNSVWGPGCMGHHHCDLGSCGIRLRAVSWLGRIPIPSPLGSLAETLKREAARVSERDAVMRRSLARHNRRHHMPGAPSELQAQRDGKSLQFRSKLLGANAVDMLATAARRAIGAAMNAIDPHPYKQPWGSNQISVGAANLFIPASAQVYVAPSMILHYISRHRYRPPDAFCDAVLRCLGIGSRAYFEALRPAVPHVKTSDFGTWVDRELELLRLIASLQAAAKQSSR